MASNKEMKRGVSQSLYRYLPESWIDFSVRGEERRQYIAKVDHWNSEKLDKINSERLIRTVDYAVRSYAMQAKDPTEKAISGFGEKLTVDNCDVLTPKVSDVERGIVAKISPLTFYCKGCNKVYQFSSEAAYEKLRKCPTCNIELTQFHNIYFCKCGYASDQHPVRCPTHGSKGIYRGNGQYNFVCHICNKKIEMQVKCPICGAFLGPKAATDPSQFFTYSLNLIDLINRQLENFISKQDYGKYITIAFWLGKITRDELDNIIQNGIIVDQDEYKLQFDKNFKMIMDVLHDEKQAKALAKTMTDENSGNKYIAMIDDIKTKLFVTADDINKLAEQIHEYSNVKELKNHATIDTAIKVAKMLNTNATPEAFKAIAEKYGISSVQACDEIPFISCSYGYTRAKIEYESGVKLRAFQPENGKRKIYAIKMSTEGVLFEFDRIKIIEWLVKNNFITLEDDINSFSEEEAKLWFINHIKPDAIRSFTPIDEAAAKETYYVYRLLHSISHLLIRAAADIGGLGKDSLAEYIFPGIPAVLIYCQNSQGFNLGSLFNTFEGYFDKWMNRAYAFAQKCVFDPICIEQTKACTGCLFLNEISCQHFNKDLDRSLLIGHVDKETKKRIIGFWEEQ